MSKQQIGKNVFETIPGWLMQEIAPVLSSPLDDKQAESTVRAILHVAEPLLVRSGTTAALVAKRLVENRGRP